MNTSDKLVKVLHPAIKGCKTRMSPQAYDQVRQHIFSGDHLDLAVAWLTYLALRDTLDERTR